MDFYPNRWKKKCEMHKNTGPELATDCALSAPALSDPSRLLAGLQEMLLTGLPLVSEALLVPT